MTLRQVVLVVDELELHLAADVEQRLRAWLDHGRNPHPEYVVDGRILQEVDDHVAFARVHGPQVDRLVQAVELGVDDPGVGELEPDLDAQDVPSEEVTVLVLELDRHANR